MIQMDDKFRERLRKIAALFEGATTPGERSAAAAAAGRVKAALGALRQTEQPSEFQFMLPDLWQRRLNHLSARLRLSTPVTLLESGLTGVPVVIGHLRPVILMPVGLLTGLPAGQIESILLH